MTQDTVQSLVSGILADLLGPIPPTVRWISILLLAVVAIVFAWWQLRRLAQAGRRAVAFVVRSVHAWAKVRTTEDILTIVAASIATGVSAQGMWNFSRDVLGLDGPLRLLLFAFIEVAVITSAVRAKRSMREKYSAGVDGIAVWVLAALTAVLSSLDAGSPAEAVFRLAAPLVAAWLWERGMAIERRRVTGRSQIHWRITPERILVRLGLAEATDRTAEDVTAQRLITRVSLAVTRARDLRETGASPRKQGKARRRVRAALASAVEYADLAGDRDRQRSMLDRIGALCSDEQLLDLRAVAPWADCGHPSVTPPLTPEADAALQELRRWESRDAVQRAADKAAVTLMAVTPEVTPYVTSAVAVPPVTSWAADPVTDPGQGAGDVTPPVTGGVTETVTGDVTPTPVTRPVTGTGTGHRPAQTAPAASSTPGVTGGVTPPVTALAATGPVTDRVTQMVTPTPRDVTADSASGVTVLRVTRPDTVTPGQDTPPPAGKGVTKSTIMRRCWDRARQETPPRYPTVTDLAQAASADHALASRRRREWVKELPEAEQLLAQTKKGAATA